MMARSAFGCGRRFRVLAVVADTSLSVLPIGRELDRFVAPRDLPPKIVNDNGTERSAPAMLRWPEDVVSPGTTLRPASFSRTGSSETSTAGSTTKASTSICTKACETRAGSSKHEGAATPRPGPVPMLNTGKTGVALTFLDLLAGVMAANTSALSCLDALAVDHGRREACLATNPPPVEHHQVVIDTLHESTHSK